MREKLLTVLGFAIAIFLSAKYHLLTIFSQQSLVIGSGTEVYQVAPSQDKAFQDVYIGTLSTAVQSGSTRYLTLYNRLSYDVPVTLKIRADILGPQAYSCSWYACQECQTYQYEVCTQYQCTIQAGVDYVKCQRTEITQWTCTKDTYYNYYGDTISVTSRYVDTYDLGKTINYLEITDVNSNLHTVANNIQSEIESRNGQVYLPWYLVIYYAPSSLMREGKTVSCVTNYQATIEIYYSDGSKTTITAPEDAEYYYDQDLDTYEILVPNQYIDNKVVNEIRVYSDGAFSNCFVEEGTVSGVSYIKVAYKQVKITSTITANDKQDKEQLESYGYTCQPSNSKTSVKTFYNITSCNSIVYTNDPNLDGQKTDGGYYWYCPDTVECLPPETIDQGTTTQTQTYTDTNKQNLYNYGCSDSTITCTQTTTVTGSLDQYYDDVYYRDAKNPDCVSWSISTVNYPYDKTKTSGEPPFYQCDFNSGLYQNMIQGALCSGPIELSPTKPLEITIGSIKRTFYKSSNDEVVITLRATSDLPIQVTAPEFQDNFIGTASVSIDVYARMSNPYLVSDSIEPLNTTGYKAAKYTAIINSPGDLYASFVPFKCSYFLTNGLKYRFAELNGEPIPGDPCNGIRVFLRKGTNKFVMYGYSINPSQLPSCVQQPNTCEEQDLLGCPMQCYAENLQIKKCKTTITIPGGYSKTTKLQFVLHSDNYAIVKVYVQGEGVIPTPKMVKLKPGDNIVTIEVTYTIPVQQSKTTTWNIVVENPYAYAGKNVETKTCSITVNVVPYEKLIEILKQPELIASILVIIVALVAMLLKGRIF